MGLPDHNRGIIDGIGCIRWRYAVPFTGQIPVFLVIPLPFSQRVDVSPSFDSSGGQREVTCRITANLNEFNTVDRLCTDAANVISERECSLGYRLSRSSYRWANYRRPASR